MKRWKMMKFPGWVLVCSLFVAGVGIYYWKSHSGIDLLQDRHLLIFQQEPKPYQPFEPSRSEGRAAQEQKVT